MKQLKCETCGAPLVLSEDGLHAHCDVCGNIYEYKTPKEDYWIEQLNEANDLRLHNDFDDAIKKYRIITKNNPIDAEAWWGLLLSTYGVAYEVDPVTEDYIPTFHRNKSTNIAEDVAGINAIDYASPHQQDAYRANVTELRRIQEGIEREAKKCDPYDVFISFKATDAEGNNTLDRDIAFNIYDELHSRGIKTFFSEVSLMDMASSNYEAVIFNALNTCKVFILVGTSKENINGTWVKNEWTRYRERVAEDSRNGGATSSHFAVVGSAMAPSDLPLLFSKTQNIMLAKYAGDSYKKDVAISVSKILGIENTKAEVNVKIDDVKVEEIVTKIAREHVVENENTDLSYYYEDGSNNRPVGYYVSLRNGDAKHIIIPSTYRGKPVVGIEDEGFQKTFIRSIKFPNCIEYIGNRAFDSCTELDVDLNFGNTHLSMLGEDAFNSCSLIKSVILPNTLKIIKKSTFNECSNITSVVINGCEEIQSKAFYGCHGLTKVTLTKNSSLRKIDDYAFTGCFRLSEIENIDSAAIESIGCRAFAHSTGLTSLMFRDTLQQVDTEAFIGCKGLKILWLGRNISQLGENIIIDCTLLELLGIGGTFEWNNNSFSVKKICLRCVWLGEEIKNCSFDSVPYFVNNAYGECNVITPYEKSPDNWCIKDGNTGINDILVINDIVYGLKYKTKTAKLLFKINKFTESTICEKIEHNNEIYTVTEIADNAFLSCMIQNIKLPNTIRIIGDKAFYDTQLKSINIPEGVVSIGDNIFALSKQIREVVLPSTLKEVGVYLFKDCDYDRLLIKVATKSQTKNWNKKWRNTDQLMKKYKTKYLSK